MLQTAAPGPSSVLWCHPQRYPRHSTRSELKRGTHALRAKRFDNLTALLIPANRLGVQLSPGPVYVPKPTSKWLGDSPAYRCSMALMPRRHSPPMFLAVWEHHRESRWVVLRGMFQAQMFIARSLRWDTRSNHSRQLHPQLVLAQKGGSSTQGKEILFTQTRSSQQSRASATSSYPISAHFHTAR